MLDRLTLCQGSCIYMALPLGQWACSALPGRAEALRGMQLYAPGPQKHDQWFPVGAALVATPLGEVALVSRQRWGLTSSLVPTAWLIEVDQTRRRQHGEEDNPGEVDLRRGDSFLIIWEDDGWTLFERYPGDVAAWTLTAIPPSEALQALN